MDWNDPPAWEPAQPPPAWQPAQPPPAEPAPDARPVSASAFAGIRRGVAAAALVVGLLAVGGTAVVLAADPSASPAPNATTEPSTGSGGATTPKTHTGNCPNMGGNGTNRSGGATAPSTTGPTSSPAL